METRGRKRKPVEVLKLQGTYEACKQPVKGADPAKGRPSMPKWMTDAEAKAHWRRVVPKLISLGIARELDAHALGSMCMWWATWRRLQKEAIKAENMRVIYAAANAWKAYDQIAQRFGLTPADRASLKFEADTTADPFTEYMKGRGLA